MDGPVAPGTGRSPGIDPHERRFRLASVAAVVLVFGALIVLGRLREPALEVETLSLYCFSGLEAPMREAVLPAFQTEHEAETGRRVEFVTTFAGSGAITERVIREFRAHIAILSSSLDAQLATRSGAGVGGSPLPYEGVVTRSPLVMVVRPGNPLGIRSWQDLLGQDVAIIHPDPVSSGAGVWSILAQHAAVEATGGTQAARDQLAGMRDRVVLWPASAARARAAFEGGAGDVLITYAHEAAGGARRSGIAGEVVVPQPTILTEHVVVRIGRSSASRRQQDVIEAFLAFLWSREAQELFAGYGLQPADAPHSSVVDAQLITLQDMGGPAEAQRRILQRVWYGDLALDIR